MRTSIATVSLSGSLEDKLAAASGAGFDGVEIFEPDLVASPMSPARVRETADGLGLSIDMYQPFRDFEGVEPGRLEANLRRARRKFELMAELGTDTMLVCSNVAPDAIDDPGLSAAQLHSLAEEAQEHGVRIAFEALAWGRHISDYRDAWSVVERADHPALGTCLDSFHILSRGSDPAEIQRIPGRKIFFLQLADAPVLGMDVLQWSRHHRCFPGQGGFDLAAFMGHVQAAGYDGPWSLEVFNDHFRQAEPERIAIDARRSLLALGDQVGAATVPPAPSAERFAFAELAVGPESGDRAAEVLEAMGFAHVGPHRSKPVHQWRQGDARVLLNHGDGHAGRHALVSALGVESADPDAAAARAKDLGAALLPRRRGPGEADLAAIAAPDETTVLFCRTTSGKDVWVGDFVDLEGHPDGEDCGLTGVDHIVLSQPFDYFDEAVLFYRSVLGLTPRPVKDVAAPHGLLSSRALEAADGRLRLAITVPRLGGGDGRMGELQHVAFASSDVLSSAHRMRDTAVPLLAVPDNYYDDLEARTELEPERIGALRAAGVLYDADGQGGEFLQLFTDMIGDRLFFEVVQRIGGYDGYGAANSPVRLAAQLGNVTHEGRGAHA
jgi:4-hydroxyphenylpyruvate dioxygenase